MRDFSIGVRFIEHVGFLEALSFVGEGAGAALYIFAIASGQLPAAALGVVLVIGAVVALLAHLGQPLRAWRALAKLGRSWVSRGTLTISIFIGVGTLSLLASWIEVFHAYAGPLQVLGVVLALAVMLYAGMMLRSMRAVRLWRGPYVPLAFIAHSLASGAILALALSAGESASWLYPAGIAFLLFAVVGSAAHLLLAERSSGVNASLERLLEGDLRAQLVWGGGLAGVVIPTLGLVLASLLGDGGLLLVLVALSRLYGDFAYRHAICLAGAYEPVAPSGTVRNLGLATR